MRNFISSGKRISEKEKITDFLLYWAWVEKSPYILDTMQ